MIFTEITKQDKFDIIIIEYEKFLKERHGFSQLNING